MRSCTRTVDNRAIDEEITRTSLTPDALPSGIVLFTPWKLLVSENPAAAKERLRNQRLKAQKGTFIGFIERRTATERRPCHFTGSRISPLETQLRVISSGLRVLKSTAIPVCPSPCPSDSRVAHALGLRLLAAPKSSRASPPAARVPDGEGIYGPALITDKRSGRIAGQSRQAV